jgi:hypothetical protein
MYLLRILTVEDAADPEQSQDTSRVVVALELPRDVALAAYLGSDGVLVYLISKQ